jgi:hypothetical protein
MFEMSKIKIPLKLLGSFKKKKVHFFKSTLIGKKRAGVEQQSCSYSFVGP